MNAPVFVDTNVFIYALDDTDRKKQAAAREWRAELWKRRQGRISFQVLQEFYVKVTSKWPKVRQAAQAEVRDLMAWRPVSVDALILEQAWKFRNAISSRFGTLSSWPPPSPHRAATCSPRIFRRARTSLASSS